jgi:hypothetical protein
MNRHDLQRFKAISDVSSSSAGKACRFTTKTTLSFHKHRLGLPINHLSVALVQSQLQRFDTLDVDGVIRSCQLTERSPIVASISFAKSSSGVALRFPLSPMSHSLAPHVSHATTTANRKNRPKTSPPAL